MPIRAAYKTGRLAAAMNYEQEKETNPKKRKENIQSFEIVLSTLIATYAEGYL